MFNQIPILIQDIEGEAKKTNKNIKLMDKTYMSIYSVVVRKMIIPFLMSFCNINFF